MVRATMEIGRWDGYIPNPEDDKFIALE